MPGRIAQRIVLLREAFGGAEVLQRVAVGAVESLALGAADAFIPPGAAEDVVLLVEALEIGLNLEAGGVIGKFNR